MPAKTVYSVRIPEEISTAMKEMEDVDWQEEIQSMIVELVKGKSKERLLREAESLRKGMEAIGAAEVIREDRDTR
ncbi:MAG: hypothetical protein HXS40_01520 [Theionarchaea archaeon]|nr:hypothetical protein [Theionarchaea archaeon]